MQSISATSALTATADRRNRSHARDVSGEGRELEPECHRSSINRNEHIVVAIDVGTAFSGYAMSSSRDKFTIYAMRADDPFEKGRLVDKETKIPTVLLLRPDGTFHSFGQDALAHYSMRLVKDEQKSWHFFERFKMVESRFLDYCSLD